MTSTQRIAAAMIFLLAGAAATIGQTSHNPEDAIRAADAAWLKTYIAKDVDKSVAACDEQGSLLARRQSRCRQVRRSRLHQRHLRLELYRRRRKIHKRQREVSDHLEKAGRRFVEGSIRHVQYRSASVGEQKSTGSRRDEIL
jgi:hypothetical protein